jgi:AcrR family transcriptional regulator
MSKNPGPNKDNLEQTRRAFIKAGKKEFAKYGYVNASTNRIVQAAGMARGSLYYHFKDKKGLFVAVYVEMFKEIEKKILKEIINETNTLEAAKKGTAKYIEICENKSIRKIILESYVVLDYAESFAINQQGMFGTTQQYVEKLMEEGRLPGQNPMITTILILGMITEAARSLEVGTKDKKFKDELISSCMQMMDKMLS